MWAKNCSNDAMPRDATSYRTVHKTSAPLAPSTTDRHSKPYHAYNTRLPRRRRIFKTPNQPQETKQPSIDLMPLPKPRAPPPSKPSLRNPPKRAAKPHPRSNLLSRLTSLFHPKSARPSVSAADLDSGSTAEHDAVLPMRVVSPRSTECVPVPVPVTPRRGRVISWGVSPVRGKGEGWRLEKEQEKGVKGEGQGNATTTVSKGSKKTATRKADTDKKIQIKGRAHASATQDGTTTHRDHTLTIEPQQKSNTDSTTTALHTQLCSPTMLSSLQTQPQRQLLESPASPGKDAPLGSHPVARLGESESCGGGVYGMSVSEFGSAKGRLRRM